MINNPLENWSPETLGTGVWIAAIEQGHVGCGHEEDPTSNSFIKDAIDLKKKKKAFGCYPGERSLRRDRRTVLLGFALRTTQNYQICKVREESLMSQG